MKFTLIFVLIVATIVTFVTASPQRQTNSERFARGLPPNPPALRRTPVYGARRSTASSTPNKCSTNFLCCETLQLADSLIADVLKALGIDIPSDKYIGETCTSSSSSICSSGYNACCCDSTYSGGILSTHYGIGCETI